MSNSYLCCHTHFQVALFFANLSIKYQSARTHVCKNLIVLCVENNPLLCDPPITHSGPQLVSLNCYFCHNKLAKTKRICFAVRIFIFHSILAEWKMACKNHINWINCNYFQFLTYVVLYSVIIAHTTLSSAHWFFVLQLLFPINFVHRIINNEAICPPPAMMIIRV